MILDACYSLYSRVLLILETHYFRYTNVIVIIEARYCDNRSALFPL